MRRALGMALLALLAGTRVALAAGPGDATDNSPAGTSALRSLGEAMGLHVTLAESRFAPPPGGGVMFILDPADTFSSSETEALVRWVSGGGVLVYAATSPDHALERELGISRATGTNPTADTRAVSGTPLLAGVATAQLRDPSPFAAVSGRQVAILHSADGGVQALAAPIGAGRFFAFSSSGPFSNGDLANADNGRIAADLLAAAGPGAEVVFDQFHHAGGTGRAGPLAWLATPWGLAILLEVLVGLGLLLLRGRRFGPVVPLVRRSDRSTAEFTTAVAAMLRRAGARRQTLGRLLEATRAALAARAGVRAAADTQHLEATLRQRSPGLADALVAATDHVAAARDDSSMAAAAAELHRLARPGFPSGIKPPQGRD